MMHDPQKSDSPIVAVKPPNNPGRTGAAAVEPRGGTKGITNENRTTRTPSRTRVLQGLERVRERAKAHRKERFTALLHHLNVDLLRCAYFWLKKTAAAGIDGITWEEYGKNLEDRLNELHGRVHRGAYRAQPSRRQFIPKADGKQRPLGIAAIEDKIVQRAVVEVLNAIYEVDFKGFSYGFRPKRGQHQALDALATVIIRTPVNWIIDADIRAFFDSVNHDWLMRFIEHRVGDVRLLRLIRKWLAAGVMQDGELLPTTTGTPQGAVISPLLANIYLHYVYDLWAERWRQRTARGRVTLVRYADDTVVGFQHLADATRFLAELRERLAVFSLSLHPEKTRCIEFGRYAIRDRGLRGLRRPETFNFLGFTHICGRSRQGAFLLTRRSRRDRLRAKVRAVRDGLRRRINCTIPQQGQWLQRVVRGFNQYHGVPTNCGSLQVFRQSVIKAWLWTLRRRSQRQRTTWTRMVGIADRWLPPARVLHPWPERRFAANHPRWEPGA
jgi:group II intron reverse transcriptase/maturase